jgi:hypothetical protein
VGATGAPSLVVGPTGPTGSGSGGGGGSSRILFETVTATSLTVTLLTALTTFYITNSGFNSITLPSTTATTDGGLYWTLRNATYTTLSITVAGANGSVLTPLILPGLSSATLVVSSAATNTVLLF